MKEFTPDTFMRVVRVIDDENNYDFETLVEALNEKYAILLDSDMDEILEFLRDELGIEHDNDVCNMSVNEIGDLCKFINRMIKDSDDYQTF
ncbi:MAG: hypothetical protein JEZ08_11650 [Clostridiales bacterium]|nr:hypothetical protein [Clostridiales bacterium]